MAFCDDPTDAANLTPEQRVDEIAAILAAGVLRLAGVPPVLRLSHRRKSQQFLPYIALMNPRKRGFMLVVELRVLVLTSQLRSYNRQLVGSGVVRVQGEPRWFSLWPVSVANASPLALFKTLRKPI